MKKFFYSVIAASMLFATSCSHEDIVDITKGEGQKVTFKVNLPEQAASRAAGDGTKADNLIFAMYENGTTEDAKEALISKLIIDSDDGDDDGQFTVTVPMAKDIKYDLLFFAYNEEHCAFKLHETTPSKTDLRALQFKENLEGNQDAYDAFVNVCKNVGINEKDEPIKLTRPFAQVNAATSSEDWNDAAETLKSPIANSVLTIQGVPSTYNVFEETATGSMTVSFSPAAPLDETLEGYTDHKYLTLAYVLAGDNASQSTATANFIFYREGDNKQVSSLALPNFPLQRNHRTNVVGKLLTEMEQYIVKIDQNIGTPNVVNPQGAASVKDVQTDQQWKEVAALLNTDKVETISIKLGGIDGRSANDNTISLNEMAIINAAKNVILDLNGWTLGTSLAEGSQTNHLYAFKNHGTLTIIDSSEGKTGKIDARGIFNYGNMTLESGTINAIDGNGGYGVRNYEGATFTMNGGTIATTLEDDNKVDKGGYDASPLRVDEGAIATINGGVINNICDFTVAIDNYGTTTINGGTFTTVHTTIANSGTMTIDGGEFTCNGLEGITAHALWAAAGTTTINGGTFDGKDNYNGFNVDASEGATVYIKGGKFLSVHSGSLYGEGTITVYGGTFFDDPSLRLAEGYKAEKDENNFYTVSRPIVATVNGQSYYSFADALSNASDNATIELVEEGVYTLSSKTNSYKLTIKGTKETVIDVTKGSYIENTELTFEGITIKTSTGYVMDENGNQGSDYAALYSEDVTYQDCNFIGPMRLGRDGAKFIGCTFSELGNDYIWTYGNDCTFEGCTFNTDGKAILIYSDGGNEVSRVSVKNCTFNATQGAKAGAIANQNCAAIEIHNLGNGVNLTTNGNTYDSNFSGEWRIKTYETGKTQVFVNGTEYTTIALDGKTMTIDADRNVTFVGSEQE